jgi:D-alanine transfer protein
MKRQHLVSVLFALLLVAGALAGGLVYARQQEARYIHVMATQVIDQMTIGEAWQRAAFQQPDLLVIYGSSELLKETGPYQALKFFHTYPTGFDTVEIARGGINSLNLAQDLAAVGPDLRGKKVVISFTPTMFITTMTGEGSYDGNFSQIHADEFIFNTQLNWELKQTAAKRMVQYPKTLLKDPILQFALERLIKGTALDRFMYYVDLPLGKLEIEVERLQDHWEVLNYIWTHPHMNPIMPHQPASIDWKDLAVKAEEAYKQESNNNSYGIINHIWTDKLSAIVARGSTKSSEKTFLRDMQISQEWVDLDILIKTLVELGAEPLVMSRPFNGAFWDSQGVTIKDRNVYYDKLDSIVAPYNIELIEFKDHDEDRNFNIDSSSHTSPKGWVYVDQALDAFYHQNFN